MWGGGGSAETFRAFSNLAIASVILGMIWIIVEYAQ